jgi:hypothetical protein
LPRIERIHWANVGMPIEAPVAVWPSPVDHDRCFETAGFTAFADSDDAWGSDFSALIRDVVHSLSSYGEPRLVTGHIPVRRRSWRRRRETASLLEAITCAATDDSLSRCVVEFGDPACARLIASDGHPILWVALPPGLDPEAWVAKLARGRPVQETSLKWSALSPRPAA